MKRTLFLLFFTGFLMLSAYIVYPFALRSVFLVKGTVEITSEMAARAAKPNTMLFLVARNENGVPVAIKKIINPVFPLNFQITPSNLIMPDILTKKIYLEAFVNSHGKLGVFTGDDITGSVKNPIFVFKKNAYILINAPAK